MHYQMHVLDIELMRSILLAEILSLLFCADFQPCIIQAKV